MYIAELGKKKLNKLAYQKFWILIYSRDLCCKKYWNKYCQAEINDNKLSEIKALKLAAETKSDSTTECVHFDKWLKYRDKMHVVELGFVSAAAFNSDDLLSLILIWQYLFQHFF